MTLGRKNRVGVRDGEGREKINKLQEEKQRNRICKKVRVEKGPRIAANRKRGKGRPKEKGAKIEPEKKKKNLLFSRIFQCEKRGNGFYYSDEQSNENKASEGV